MLLIVEDNETLQLYMRTLLARLGLKVITATSGEQALQQFALHEGEISMIFMDWNLSGSIDGPGCTAKIRQRNVKLPIIGVTAHATEEYRQACLSAGMSDFLSKPFTSAEITMMVDRWQSHSAPLCLAV